MGWLILVAALTSAGFYLGTSIPKAPALDPLLPALMGVIIGCLIAVGLGARP
jgi:hypothetical protein